MLKKGNSSKRFIDLKGSGGNAYSILATAKGICDQLKEVDPKKYDWEKIEEEMKFGNYKNLVETFEKYFGDFVDIYNSQVLDD